MLPISDDPGPRRRFPIVNYALIAINIAVFIYEVIQPDQCFELAYSAVPAGIVHNHAYAIQGCAITQPSPVYITLLTSMFLHANLLHIGGNMLYLFIFGDNVEDRLGHIPYLIFYLCCGLVASISQIIVSPASEIPNLGASGAIAGVLGAYLIFYPGSRVRTIIFLGFFFTMARLPALIVIGIWIALQFFLGLQSLSASPAAGGVAYFAHIGGFVAGLLIALILLPLTRQKQKKYQQSYPYWPSHPDLNDYYRDTRRY